MKQKHLYSLLDQSYTTIGVVFEDYTEAAREAAVPAPAPRLAKRSDNVPWGAPQAGPKVYTYKAPRDAAIELHDYVVVFNDRIGFRIGRVTRVDATPQLDLDANYDYKWIVQKIDASGYSQRVEAERAFADTMLEIERVRQKEDTLKAFHNNLPEGSEARRLFDRTIQSLTGPVVEHEPPATPDADNPRV